jgi:hypothetical protein
MAETLPFSALAGVQKRGRSQHVRQFGDHSRFSPFVQTHYCCAV